MASQDTRVAGCDLGKLTAKFVVGRLQSDPAGLTILHQESVEHNGRPMEAFSDWYRRRRIHECAALGATGLYAGELRDPVQADLPEEACLEATLAGHVRPFGPLNLVTIGARGYGVLVRDEEGRVRSTENDKCSSGTGETMVKIASRFGLSIEEADRLAASADASIPITARCSVFAKSEMTHFGNQGRPAEALFRGYFESVGRYVAALLGRVRVEGPVYVAGGCARNEALVGALSAAVGSVVHVPEQALFLEAIGAATLAAERPVELPVEPEALIRPRENRFVTLKPAREWSHRVTRLPPSQQQPMTVAEKGEPCVLGLDLGSTGSKAVLTRVTTGEPVLSIYDRTQGNPVDAVRRLLRQASAHGRLDVRAIGVTGSGREAVATVLRASFPELGERLLVLTEIVAHATAAIRCDPEGGRSLSVVEIGGQDAKFIQIAAGQIVESDMNKACSAGTGSFLEEQAMFYGIAEIETFTELAATGERPPDLGQMCTVFVADAAAEAAGYGYSVPDLFAGFQYSVIHNYMDRVMGQRTFGDRIFFQGKPATGRSLAWTLAAVTGREVMVPPDPGAMGAWGIGLCAVSTLGLAALESAPAVDLELVQKAAVVGRREFQCRDKRCDTLCTIERTTVRVNGGRHTVLSGGACPKYEVARGSAPKLPVGAPNPFAERAQRRARLEETQAGRRGPIRVPEVGALVGVLPWLVTFLKELGYQPGVVRPGPDALARGEERCFAYDACAPIKVAHGTLEVDDPALPIFLPKVLTVPDAEGPGGTTCPMEQALPDTLRESLRARGHEPRLISPPLSLRRLSTPKDVVRRLTELSNVARALGVDGAAAGVAARRADQAQESYEAGLLDSGRRALAWAAENDIPVVVVCGSLHVLHDAAINAAIPRLLAENGVLALPMDCFPVEEGPGPLTAVPWGDANRVIRVAAACRAQGGSYPLLLTSFGCGPSSFVEQIFTDVLEGYPHTVLETDGHGGTAGYVTRVQAFLHTVRKHEGTAHPAAPHRLERLESRPPEPVETLADARLLILPVGTYSEVIAGTYRAFGYNAESAGLTSPEVLAAGRRSCSGKECLPYQLIWGAFQKQLDADDSEQRVRLLQATGQGSCRNCMFSIKDRINLERLGLSHRVEPRHLGSDDDISWSFMARVWSATVAWDTLFQLASYYRPGEAEPGSVDRLYERHVQALVELVEVPAGTGLARQRSALAFPGRVQTFLEVVTDDFAALAARGTEPQDRRTVLVAGDIYLRVDDFASDGLIRRLNALGIRVIAEAVGPLTEYLAESRSGEIIGLPTDPVDNAFRKRLMRGIRARLQRPVRAKHPWLPHNDSPAMLEAGRHLIDTHPHGEAPATVGAVLYHWNERVCDGVVLVSPWGCGPALITESLLKHEREIPILFVYGDGTPMDERRLRSFAFTLRRKEARTRVRPQATASAHERR